MRKFLSIGILSLDVTAIAGALSQPRTPVAEKQFVKYIGFTKQPTIV